jgi:hypothetical protein
MFAFLQKKAKVATSGYSLILGDLYNSIERLFSKKIALSENISSEETFCMFSNF